MNKVQTTYKQTEIGLIPEEWEVKELDSILTFGSGQDYKHLSKGNIPVYGTGGIMTFVDDFLFDGDSVGIGRKGTIDKPVFLSRKFWTVDTLFYTHSFIQTTAKYVYFKFLTIRWKDYNEASGVPSLNKNNLGKIKIPLPPLPEQKAIAQVLSDTDNLIQAIEQKLTKKRAIKQGAMQQLLTPKEDWEVKNYIDIFIKHQSKNFQINSKEYETNGKFPVVDQGKKILVAYSNNDNKLFKIQEDGIIVFGDHTRIIKYIDFNFVVGADGTQLLSTKNIFSTKFIYYLLLNKEIPNTGYNRHFKYILEMNFPIPKSKEEQNEIATILSDMDAEIEQLEQKLSKYKMLKQGLMQNLLTGKIRLV